MAIDKDSMAVKELIDRIGLDRVLLHVVAHAAPETSAGFDLVEVALDCMSKNFGEATYSKVVRANVLAGSYVGIELCAKVVGEVGAAFRPGEFVEGRRMVETLRDALGTAAAKMKAEADAARGEADALLQKDRGKT